MLERITRREEADLFVAWMAIAISFTIIKIAPYGITGPVSRIDPVVMLLYLGISLITVGVGFILHEMAHKFTAIRYGYWAEFRKDNTMLLIAVVMSALIGFVFAAPGATVIYSPEGRVMSRKENGIISASGPAINLLLCALFAVLVFASGGISGLQNGNLIAIVGLAGVQINAMLAGFNLIPISILDGRKVFAWNIPVFLVMAAAAFGTLYLSFTVV
jgi:Zn-dependent protease